MLDQVEACTGEGGGGVPTKKWEFAAARDDLVGKEWAFHNAILAG